jgi:hypothetical protein
MSNIRATELRLIEDIFETKSGYVLDFSNLTFAEFFANEVGVDIYGLVYADAGNSKGKRLRTFLQKGQDKAVAKALNGLWEYRQDQMRRSGAAETIRGAREELSRIIERLGCQPLTGLQRPVESEKVVGDPSTFERLDERFNALHSLAPQQRGYAFERFLKELFDAFGMEAHDAFRTIGEQIDGSFILASETYLLEAKWQNLQTGAMQLHAFQGKVETRPAWARGLFVSYSGFTDDGLRAFGGRRIVLMDGLDISDALRRRLSVADVITAKLRRAVETNSVFIRVRDLFPE